MNDVASVLDMYLYFCSANYPDIYPVLILVSIDTQMPTVLDITQSIFE